MFSNFRHCCQVMKDHSKMTKMHFWIIQEPKKEVLGHFLEFGLSDRLDIAYCERNKCVPTFGNVTRSWRIIQRSQKCIFEWSKSPKKRFLAIFLSLVCWIDLLLHIVIVLNVFQHKATLSGHDDHSKITEVHFWMIQRAKRRFLAIFWSLVCWIDLVLHIVIVLNAF